MFTKPAAAGDTKCREGRAQPVASKVVLHVTHHHLGRHDGLPERVEDAAPHGDAQCEYHDDEGGYDRHAVRQVFDERRKSKAEQARPPRSASGTTSRSSSLPRNLSSAYRERPRTFTTPGKAAVRTAAGASKSFGNMSNHLTGAPPLPVKGPI